MSMPAEVLPAVDAIPTPLYSKGRNPWPTHPTSSPRAGDFNCQGGRKRVMVALKRNAFSLSQPRDRP